MQLEIAEKILAASRAKAREMGLKPLAITVLDARGALRTMIAEDGASLHRADVAIGKAYGAISMGVSSRALGERAEKQAYFVAAASHICGGKLVPVAGGVLIHDDNAQIIGAVGISGDSSDNDEIAACHGISSVGLTPHTGA
ncbi:MAG: heme-binding protein [Pseudomonadota bacterium]